MGEDGVTDEYIYERDVAWLREADFLVAEVTTPSLGVGYELGYAEARGKPTLCLFRPTSGRSMSAMIRGNARFVSKNYDTVEEAAALIDDFVAQWRRGAAAPAAAAAGGAVAAPAGV
jgi:nucleoside 2-deoxyribosyltransferase